VVISFCQSAIDGAFLSMIRHNDSQILIYMSTFEIYGQSEMLPNDSTNKSLRQIAAGVESVDMATKGVLAAAEVGYGEIMCGYQK
jgi:hypothetical protein